MSKTVTVIRGLPGSGKTSLAQALAAATGAVLIEPDDYYARSGTYEFSHRIAPYAHLDAQHRALTALEGRGSAIVADVFPTLADLEPYRQLAADFGAAFQVVEVAGPWPDRHGVVPEDRARMIATWEPWPRTADSPPKGKTMTVTTPTPTLPAIGAPFEGGYFAGTFLLGNQTFALIVAPKAEGETSLPWLKKNKEKVETAARSLRDGLANSDAINDDDHPAARFCRDLTIGGFDDWYLPSRHEAALLAENLMPGAGYVPAQTTAEAFKDGGPEAFAQEWYWSSTEFSAGYAWGQGFGNGGQVDFGKDWQGRFRAVRKYPL